MSNVSDHAVWLSQLIKRAVAAQQAGDIVTVTRLIKQAGDEGSPAMRLALEQALAANTSIHDSARTGRTSHVDFTQPAGTAPLCDFCSADPVAYMNVAAFTVYGTSPDRTGLVQHNYAADRWHMCPTCQAFITAGDWEGLRLWCAVPADNTLTLEIWANVRRHRHGGIQRLPSPNTPPA